jgi:hypothetical protein
MAGILKTSPGRTSPGSRRYPQGARWIRLAAPQWERDVLRILSRLAVGIAVYLVILLFATSLPLAAGVMLTVPAVNGLAFFFSQRSSIEPMARTMIWMPLVNGVLCALYIVLFLLLVPHLPPAILVWGLTALVVVLWLVIVTRRRLTQGIEPARQFGYGMVVTAAGIALIIAAVFFQGQPEVGAQGPRSLTVALVLETLARNQIKIVLFALCLLIFLLAANSRAIADWVKGILAGLPIIPLGSLVSITIDSGIAPAERLHIFRVMAISVWLSPAVPIWFIVALSRFYSARMPSGTAVIDGAARFLAVVAGWVLCFAAILAISFVVAAVW